MQKLHFKIVSPEKKVYDEEGFDSITLPTEEGEITVLPGHLPIVGKIAPGEIIARKNNKEESIVTLKGFFRVSAEGEISILSDYATRSEDIEVAKVQEAKKKAEDLMKEKANEKDFAIAEAELRRTLLELKVAQKRKIKID